MLKRVVIIGDGCFPRKEYPRYLISTADIIVCCDGAFRKYMRHCKDIFGKERLPDAVIGDMDSLSENMKRKYQDIIIRVDEQEHNDQTKAFTWVLDNVRDISDICILGATGEREDHTIGNISLLMEYARRFDLKARGINVEMVSDFSTIFAITDSVELDCGTGRSISIFSPDNTLTIRSSGLEWPTDGVLFDNWWKATLNKAVSDTVKLVFSHRSIALIIMN